jgi:hypothetical protein
MENLSQPENIKTNEGKVLKISKEFGEHLLCNFTPQDRNIIFFNIKEMLKNNLMQNIDYNTKEIETLRLLLDELNKNSSIH